MRDKQLCADIGKRIKQRRKELNLSLGYIADKMGVNISTAQRYEAGLIDNSKKLLWTVLLKYFTLHRNGYVEKHQI